jgi:hypothetical protein
MSIRVEEHSRTFCNRQPRSTVLLLKVMQTAGMLDGVDCQTNELIVKLVGAKDKQ